MKKLIFFLPVLLAIVVVPYRAEAQSCCLSSEASVKKSCTVSLSQRSELETSQSSVSQSNAVKEKPFSMVSSKPVLYLFSSLFASGISSFLSLIESCDPSCCDPADCDPTVCDPLDCLPLACEKK